MKLETKQHIVIARIIIIINFNYVKMKREETI